MKWSLGNSGATDSLQCTYSRPPRQPPRKLLYVLLIRYFKTTKPITFDLSSCFTLNPNKDPKIREPFKFQSTNPAPIVNEMKIFEDRLANLVKNVKFGRKQNKFQETLKKETQRIMADPRPLIAADKMSNYYFMKSKDYKDLVEKEIHKEYKKANHLGEFVP